MCSRATDEQWDYLNIVAALIVVGCFNNLNVATNGVVSVRGRAVPNH